MQILIGSVIFVVLAFLDERPYSFVLQSTLILGMECHETPHFEEGNDLVDLQGREELFDGQVEVVALQILLRNAVEVNSEVAGSDILLVDLVVEVLLFE